MSTTRRAAVVQRAYGTTPQQDYATYTTAQWQPRTVKDANGNLSTFDHTADRL